MLKNRLLTLLLLLTGLVSKSQLITRPVIIEPKLHTGLVVPLYEAMNYLITEDIYSFDISAGFPTFGKNYWEKLYRYPRTGFGYSYWSLGNNEILGKAHALYSFINIPFLKQTEKISFNYQISFGAAYLTKRFDKYEDHLNRAIGSHLNAYVRLGVDCSIKLAPRSNLLFEAGVSHFSNGKTKSPNYGINAGSISLGFNYHFNNNSIALQDPEIPEIGKRYVQSVIYSAGSKVYDNLLGKKYFVSSGSYNIERILNHKRKVGLGADLFYDGSIKEALSDKDGTPENDFAKLIRVGLHTSYAIRYNQMIMGIQVGHYLYSKYTVLTNVYFRISVQYILTRNLIGSVSIKSHMGKADTLEWGIGYCWE
jgi:hypothetical protein